MDNIKNIDQLDESMCGKGYPILNKIWLNFCKQELNSSYYEQRQQYEKRIFFIVSIYLNITFLIDTLQNFLMIDMKALGIYRGIELIFFLFCTFLARKRYQFSQIGLLITFFCDQFVYWYYLYQQIMDIQESSLLIVYGLYNFQRTMFHLISIRQWFIQAIGFSVWGIIFITGLNIPLTNTFFTIVLGSVIIICSYLTEKNQKLTYYYIEMQQRNLQDWKRLINEYIPLIVFKVKNNVEEEEIQPIIKLEYSFENQACLNIMQQQSCQKIEQFLKIIYIDNEFQINQQITQQFNSVDTELSLHQIIVDKFKNDIEVKSQKNKSKSNNKNEQQDQLSFPPYLNYHCKMMPQNQRSDQIQQTFYLDVQLISISSLEFIVLISDVSQKRRILMLQMADQYKNKILQTVTHELKTPLNGMISILEASEKCQNIKVAHQLHGMVKKNAFLLYYMINQILDYCQVIKSRLNVKIRKFNLKKAIKKIINLTDFQIQKKQLFLNFNYNLDPDKEIENDELRLQEVLLILVNNAMKYTEQGDITINVQQKNVQEIEIAVEDTGIGMSQFRINSLLTHFSSGIQDINNQQSGVGLGLMISHYLIQYLGPEQKLIIESTVNKGSRFSFVIFIKNQQKSACKHEIEESKIFRSQNQLISIYNLDSQDIDYQFKNDNLESINKDNEVKQNLNINNIKNLQQEDFKLEEPDECNVNNIPENNNNCQTIAQQYCFNYKSMQSLCQVKEIINYDIATHNKQTHILIVDDVPYNQLGLQLLLQNTSYKFQHSFANNGKQAVDKVISAQAQKNQYDIIFLDINMPIMDGVEAMQIIRNLEKSNEIQKIIIVVVTTLSNEQEKFQFLSQGADYFLSKPIIAEELNSLLLQIFKIKKEKVFQ